MQVTELTLYSQKLLSARQLCRVHPQSWAHLLETYKLKTQAVCAFSQ